MCAFLLAVLILHGVVDVPAALKSKLVTQLWSSIPPLHHRLHLNRIPVTGIRLRMASSVHKLKKSGQGIKQDKVIKMFLFLLLHLVGLHDTTILGPDSFKGGLDVVVPLDYLMIIRCR